VRVFGEVREGHFGREIVHPQFKVVEAGTPLPDRLTPVYPTTAGLGQETLRRVIARALASDVALTADSLPEALIAKHHLWKFPDAVHFLHTPPPRLSKLTQRALDERTHPAWTRLKFDELVAQQLSLKAHRKARAARRAPVLTGTGTLTGALLAWQAASADQQTKWAGAYSDALAAAPDGDPHKVKPGDYGPVPILANRFLRLAASGSLEGLLTTRTTFYGSDATKPLLLLADGAYLEDQARADHLGGDQWGMMNETGSYPGQPWMWLYTFWYQVEPFSSSGNADALVWGLMVVLTLGLILLPFIPGLRGLPRHLGVHKLIWRESARGAARGSSPPVE
jgi:hypothetical protein